MVMCAKLGRFLPGLDRPPFPGPLGERIYNEISRQAWQMWQGQSTILINHYGLVMADPEARKFLMEQMEQYFFGPGAQLPEEWVAPSEKGAVQSAKGGGMQSSKGGGPPVPRRK
ncbi:MAG: oxidative damage protection protein [Chloroflexi bacterium]|nr:oxidative damage protection protein [Chloroflexota bacterium]